MLERLTRRRSYTEMGAPQLTVVPGTAPERRPTTRAERLGKVSLFEKLFPSFTGGAEKGIGKAELAMFSRQLATFLGAGVAITQALNVIADETRSKALKRVLRQVLEDLGEGLSVAESFSRYPKMFGPLYVNMVRAAELTGNLDTVLRKLDEHLTREDVLAKKIKNALTYPVVVILMAAISVVVLVGFVLPRFRELFAEFNAELPLPTQILLTIAEFTTTQRPAILAVLGAFVGTIIVSQRFEKGRYLRDAFMLKLPVIGTLVRYSSVTRFTRTLATMLASGVPVARSFDIVVASTGNRVIQKALVPVKERLLSGEGFAGPLNEANVFPPMVVQMVRVGEETGSLDQFLGETAAFYDSEFSFRLEGAIALIEPMLMLSVGGIVGFIAVAMISAIYSLSSSLK